MNLESQAVPTSPGALAHGGLSGRYERRRTQDTVLYQVVKENYRSFAAVCQDEDRPLPAFIRGEFEKYLGCGVMSEGFARVHCGACGYDRFVGFSCKRRDLCPASAGRRMNDGAAFLTDCIIGDTPVRHWVLSLPPPLRFLLAYEPSLVSEVLRAYLVAVFHHLRWKVKRLVGLGSVNQAFPGAVTAIQRNSSHLALNVHFHAIVTDGVFVQRTPDGPVEFQRLPAPTDEEVTQVAWETCRRTRDLLVRRGLWRDEPEPGIEEPSDVPDPALASLYQASVRGVISLGPRRGERVVRFFGQVARDYRTDNEVPQAGGFNLHARQAVQGGDRAGLERLARYVLRPPLAQARLERGTGGSVILHMKRSWRDGTTAVAFEPLDFMGKHVLSLPKGSLLWFPVLDRTCCVFMECTPPTPGCAGRPSPSRTGRQERRAAVAPTCPTPRAIGFVGLNS